MARDFGIASISGCAIANVGKRSNVVKSDIWSVSDQQRQSSLFRTLSHAGEITYTQGKNSASFSIDGGDARVYFAFDNNAASTNYEFVFNVSGLRAAGWFCALSSTTSFGRDVKSVIAISGSGDKTLRLSSRSWGASNVYLGIWNDGTSGNRDTIIIKDLLVNVV